LECTCPRSLAFAVIVMAIKALSIALVLAAARATELTSATWDQNVAGKSVFIKFQAPW